MKNLFLFVFGVFGFIITSSSQNIDFGVKAGVNFATITGDYTDDVKGRTAFHIGAVAEVEINEIFSIQPELLYSAQGFKTEYKDSGSDWSEKDEVTVKLDYINVPIIAKYYVIEGLSIEAGPQIGFLISAEQDYKYTYTDAGETYSESGTEDVKEYLKTIDFGLNFGVGYKMKNGLNFGARYNLGLSNINDIEGIDDKNQNSVFQVSVGYWF